MSETKNLKLLKHDNPSTNTEQFDIEHYLNKNWDKLDEEVEKNAELRMLSSELEGKTVEGTNIDINDSAEMRAKLKISGNYEQEVRSGKNKFFLPESTAKNGITYTKNEDGTFNISGTATADTEIILYKELSEVGISGNNSFTMSINQNANIISQISLWKNSISNPVWVRTPFNLDCSSSKQLTKNIDTTDATIIRTNIRVNSGKTVNYTNLKVQVESGTAMTDWEAYGATPAPSIPSEIATVGNNKNYFNVNDYVDNMNVDSTGKIYYDANEKLHYFEIVEGHIYKLKRDVKSLFVITFQNKIPSAGNSGTARVVTDTNISEYSIVAPSGYKYMCIRESKYNRSTELNDTLVVKDLTSDEGGSVSVKIQNKNIFDEEIELGTFDANGQVASTTVCVRTKNYQVVKPYTQYLILNDLNYQSIIQFYDKNKKFIKSVANENNTFFTTLENVKYIKWRTSIGKTENNTNVKYMLVESNTAIDYIEHQEQNFIMPCQKEMIDESDYFDTKNYKEVHNWKKLILDGSENWKEDGSNRGFIITAFASDNTQYIKCTHFTSANSYTTWIGSNYIGFNTTHVLWVQTSVVETYAVSDFKAYLKSQYDAGTPVTIYYKLETPEQLDMTEEQRKVADEIEKAKTYYEVTHISSEDEVSPNMSVTYKRSNKLRIKNLEKALLSQGGGV